MKEESDRALKYSKSTNRLREANISHNALSSLFSKQFLSNVKHELSKRTASSRCIEHPDISKNSAEGPGKVRGVLAQNQLQLLSQRMQNLSKENQELKKLVEEMRSEIAVTQQKNSQHHQEILSSRVPGQIKLFSTVLQVNIESQKQEQTASEIERLKEKISILELHKSVKQKRINELLQKEVRYESEIRLLRMKETCLESEVKNLKESIKVQLSDFEQKPLAKTNISEINIVIPEKQSISNPSEIASPSNNQQRIDELCKNLNIDTCSLITSHCEAFQVPQEMHISKMWMKMSHKSEINEIDEIIQEQLPFVKCSADLEAEEEKSRGIFRKGNIDFNASQIRFDLSQDFKPKAAPLEQSIIEINLNDKLPNVKRQESLVVIDL